MRRIGSSSATTGGVHPDASVAARSAKGVHPSLASPVTTRVETSWPAAAIASSAVPMDDITRIELGVEDADRVLAAAELGDA